MNEAIVKEGEHSPGGEQRCSKKSKVGSSCEMLIDS